MAAVETFEGNYFRAQAELDAWAAQTQEAALEPDLPIVDPHHHFWDDHRGRYLVEALRVDLAGGHKITATVFVECMSAYRAEGPEPMKPVGEVEFVRRLAESPAAAGPVRMAAATVGFADLTLGDRVDAVLEALLAADPQRFRGIRHAVPSDPAAGVHAYRQSPPGLMGTASFRAGFARLAARGMSFDAWLYHPQLGDVADLAAAFPEATIVMDHVGGMLGVGEHARRPDETFARWRESIRALARRPNVVVKLGGLGMLSFGFGVQRRATPPSSAELVPLWRPFIETCIEAFGPTRCMFESNFPVDKQSCGYMVIWNVFKRIAAGCSADEKAALFSGTATRVYRIGAG